MSGSRSYSWMPDWLKKFLNLDEELPNYGPNSGGAYTAPEYKAVAPPARPAVSYTPTPVPATSYTPPPPTWTPTRLDDNNAGNFRLAGPPQAEGEPAAAPPPPPAWKGGPPAGAEPGSVPPPAGSMAAAAGEGYVQPVGYMFRAYSRGALPPQGLEQFTREFRATLTDVWNFYGYWTRFQTDEVFRLGRVVVDTVVDNLPSGEGTAAPSSRTKRPIKVTAGNGNGDKKVQVVAPTPTTPAAAAPTPPAAAAPTPPAAAAPTTPAVVAPTPPAPASDKPTVVAPTASAAAPPKPSTPASNKPKDKK